MSEIDFKSSFDEALADMLEECNATVISAGAALLNTSDEGRNLSPAEFGFVFGQATKKVLNAYPKADISKKEIQ